MSGDPLAVPGPPRYGVVHLKEGIFDPVAGNFRRGWAGIITLIPRNEMGLKRASGEESWAVRVHHPEHPERQVYVLGCQIRAVRFGRPTCLSVDYDALTW